MGTSTDAILFYGICWDEEDHRWNWRPWVSFDMDDEEVAEASPLPVADRIDPDDDETTDQEWVDERVTGVTVGEHCCASAPMGFVAITESVTEASRGNPVRVGGMDRSEAAQEDDAESWERALREFCRVAYYDYDGLMREGKIGWFLVSWWSE